MKDWQAKYGEYMDTEQNGEEKEEDKNSQEEEEEEKEEDSQKEEEEEEEAAVDSNKQLDEEAADVRLTSGTGTEAWGSTAYTEMPGKSHKYSLLSPFLQCRTLSMT
jgi:hypothetical protein